MEGVAGTPEMVLDLGDVVDTIDLARLDTRAVAAGDDFDGFDRVRGMGGYTWLKPSTEQSQPSILVPGEPLFAPNVSLERLANGSQASRTSGIRLVRRRISALHVRRLAVQT